MKLSIAIGKFVSPKAKKVTFKVLGADEDADTVRSLVDKAGEKGDIVEGYVIKNPDRSFFSYRRNFEAPLPPIQVIAPRKPLTAEETGQLKMMQALGSSLPNEATSEQVAQAASELAARLAAIAPDAEPTEDETPTPETPSETSGSAAESADVHPKETLSLED